MQPVPFAELRSLIAAALAPVDPEEDPPVHAGPVDALDPPALMVWFAGPVLEPATDPPVTQSPAPYWCRLSVVCVSPRIEIEGGLAILESLIDYVYRRVQAHSAPWPAPAEVSGPVVMNVANVPYLTARVNYRILVNLGG